MADIPSFQVDESRLWFSKEAGWPDEVPKNVEFPAISLGDMLRRSAEEHGERNAVWFLDTFMNYRELDAHVDAFATALSRRGIKKGDVVTLLLPNSFQYVIAYYACMRLGVIASGVNPTYKPFEILHQLDTVGSKALIVLDALYEPQIAPIIDKHPFELVVATNVADMADLSGLKKFIGKLLGKIPTGPVPDTALRFTDMLKTPVNLPEVEIDVFSDPATYIMTGGTTGVPKAAVLTHHNCVSNCIQSKEWIFKIKPGACAIGVLPMFHSFAMTCVMNITLSIGAFSMLFPRPPDNKELVETIIAIGPDDATMYVGAEVLFQRMAEFLDDPQNSHYLDKLAGKLALCVSGAGPLHRPVQEKFERVTGGRLVEGYGLTESTPVVSASPFWGERKIGTIGLPFPGTDWKIVDKDDHKKDLPVGESGEIAIAGPQVMKGYLNKPEETAETIVEMDGKRWLLTGDIGFMDELGRITINDRKKQLIKYKGYSVFPKEVEELVGGHEAVNEVAVSGLPDEETGEVIKAWVVLNQEYIGKITESELHAWCKDNLTHYKVPRHVEFREELPKSMVGKVLRRELQEADPIWKKAHPEGGEKA